MLRKSVLFIVLVVLNNAEASLPQRERVLTNQNHQQVYVAEKFKHHFFNQTDTTPLACEPNFTKICKVNAHEKRYCFPEDASKWISLIDSTIVQDIADCKPVEHVLDGSVEDLKLFDHWRTEYLWSDRLMINAFKDDGLLYSYCVAITDKEEKKLYGSRILNTYDLEDETYMLSERKTMGTIQVGKIVTYTNIACGPRQYVEKFFNDENKSEKKNNIQSSENVNVLTEKKNFGTTIDQEFKNAMWWDSNLVRDLFIIAVIGVIGGFLVVYLGRDNYDVVSDDENAAPGL